MLYVFNTIEEAISDFRDGKTLIVVDDDDRENEGDFICAAEKATPETQFGFPNNTRTALPVRTSHRRTV